MLECAMWIPNRIGRFTRRFRPFPQLSAFRAAFQRSSGGQRKTPLAPRPSPAGHGQPRRPARQGPRQRARTSVARDELTVGGFY